MPHVFLSYCREDSAKIAPFRAALESSGVPLWLDSLAMQAGDNLPASIEAGLRDAVGAVIFLSQTYLRKGWTQAEMRYLTTRMIRDSALRLIVVHLDGCEVPPLLEPILRSTPDDAATVAALFSKSWGLAIPGDRSDQGRDIPVGQFLEALPDLSIIALADLFISRCADAVFRASPALLPFKSREQGRTSIELMSPVPDIAVNELSAARKILTIHQQFCANYDKQIKQAGLGLFQTAFELELGERTLAYKATILDIRRRIDGLIMSVVHAREGL